MEFGVLKLGFEVLAGRAARGSTGRGVGGREPPPRTGSNTPTKGSTDFEIKLGSYQDYLEIILQSFWDHSGIVLG